MLATKRNNIPGNCDNAGWYFHQRKDKFGKNVTYELNVNCLSELEISPSESLKAFLKR